MNFILKIVLEKLKKIGVNKFKKKLQTYVNSVTQYGRRVVTKRIHESIDPTSNSINEESEILQKIQMEIEILTKENDLLKKDYEAVTKRVDSVNMVFNEAKARQKMAMEEKRQLQRDLTRAKYERL